MIDAYPGRADHSHSVSTLHHRDSFFISLVMRPPMTLLRHLSLPRKDATKALGNGMLFAFVQSMNVDP
jgi:hypothetical protein